MIKNRYEQCKQTAKDLIKSKNWNINSVMGRTRKADIVEKRHYVMKELHDQGFSYLAIAKAFKRHHTSIMYVCDNRIQKEHRKRYLNSKTKGVEKCIAGFTTKT